MGVSRRREVGRMAEKSGEISGESWHDKRSTKSLPRKNTNCTVHAVYV